MASRFAPGARTSAARRTKVTGPYIFTGTIFPYCAYATVKSRVAYTMATDRAADFRASAAECLMLASTATDPIVREEQLARAEDLLRLAEKHERVAASRNQRP
jgi:hypothetical protein